ncbi:ester cyclase [Donghicola mangrovi]|uniref:SnoaL-like domain-containing protein n=1 Tax=Donghicola mangrovi TaxID=2729614 RepID=A0A850Q8N1_9RHOB|nr:ester cyclase [Donghicola mangrovi]NVO25274.1 SnoaL-like domain-containing protein [Donghicola mangrovi]
MTRDEILVAYSGYIACLNAQDWPNLQNYVSDEATYNGTLIGLDGYRAMLIGDFKAIPDLKFHMVQVMCDPPVIAARLAFDCTPVGDLFDLPVNGKRVQFSENVFYEFAGGKIRNVWSVIDKAAIAAQLCTGAENAPSQEPSA